MKNSEERNMERRISDWGTPVGDREDNLDAEAYLGTGTGKKDAVVPEAYGDAGVGGAYIGAGKEERLFQTHVTMEEVMLLLQE